LYTKAIIGVVIVSFTAYNKHNNSYKLQKSAV
jgi:hypothetical protein